MAYTKLTWNPGAAPAICSSNLQHLETQYDEAVVYSTTYMAPLASAPLTGTPNAPTAAILTNTTQLATCAYVMGSRISATPSATVKKTVAAEISQANATATYKQSIYIPPQYVAGSSFRIKWDMCSDNGNNAMCEIRSHAGKVHTTVTVTSTVYAAKSADIITVAGGDIIEMWLYAFTGNTCFAKNFQVCGDDAAATYTFGST